MEQDVARQGVGVALFAALGICITGDVRELSQQVVAIKGQEQAAFQQWPGEASVPNNVGTVYLGSAVTSAGIDCEVGRELHLQRKLDEGRGTIVIALRREVLKAQKGAGHTLYLGIT